MLRRGDALNDIITALLDRANGISKHIYDQADPRAYARKQIENARQGHGRAAGWPQIIVKAGELPRVVNEAEAALLSSGQEFYQRGGLVVRPVLLRLPSPAADGREISNWQLVPVGRPYLVMALTAAARFVRFDARVKDFVPIDAPDKVADTYLASAGKWRLPDLAGIVNTPFLRADGSVCEQEGYDAASGILFKADGQHFPPVPQWPDKADAMNALGSLKRLTCTFPFVSRADWAVALSAILTLLDRRNMLTAPLHAFTAPSAGTGKSLLIDMAAMIATGRRMPVIAQGKKEEELEKRLGSALLAGDLAICLDNCRYPLYGDFLCQALTQERLNIRVLGFSRIIETPVNAAIYATGNNLVITDDVTRRALLCSLDAKLERPELREFDDDAVEIIRNKRGELVAAALTILRAWHIADERMSLPPFGGFENWSRRIREALVWLDEADPCDTVDKVRASDPTRDALVAVIAQWERCLGIGSEHTV